MTLLFDLIGQVAALLLRLMFTLVAAAFALGVLLIGLVVVLFMLLRALLTGRKPMPFMVWQRYREASRASRARWTNRARSPWAQPAADDDVTDVDASPVHPSTQPARPRLAPADTNEITDVQARDIPPR